MKRTLIVLTIFILIVSPVFAWGFFTPRTNGNPMGTPGVQTGAASTEYTPNESSRDITSDAYDAMPQFEQTLKVQLDGTNVTIGGVSITEKKQTIVDGVTAKIEDSVIKVNCEKYSGSTIAFEISGSCSGYGFQVKGNKSSPLAAVEVILKDAKITSTNSPCINMNNVTTTYIVASGNSTLNDGRVYGTGYSEEEGVDYYSSSFKGTAESDAVLTAKWALGDSSKGTVYSKGAIVLDGSGSVTVNEGYKHGFSCKDYIKVNGGSWTVNSTGRNGFQTTNGFVMNDGSLVVNGTGTNTNNQSRGIVVEGSEDNPGEGFIVINGGNITIKTVGKAITAKWDIDEDSETTETTDNPYPYVRINGGTIDITTTGTPYEGNRAQSFTDADGATVSETISLAPEGIEGKQAVFISGGDIKLNCTDDCINASRDGSASIEISGGTVYAYSSTNDGIDSNGSIKISGGTVVAIATNVPECAFDCDRYTFSVTGGTIAGIGTSNYSEPTSSACTQGVLVLASSYLGSAGKTIALKDSDGDIVYAFTVPSGTNVSNGLIGIFSSPSMTSDGTYSLVKGAKATKGTDFNGLYTSMPSVSGGSTSTGITFSNMVYTAGSTGNTGPREGDRGQMPPGGMR